MPASGSPLAVPRPCVEGSLIGPLEGAAPPLLSGCPGDVTSAARGELYGDPPDAGPRDDEAYPDEPP